MAEVPSDDSNGSGLPRALAEVAPALHAWASLKVRGGLRARIEPEDLVQEVGLRACARASDYDAERGPFRAWLFGIANNVWLETLRELGRDPLSGRHRRGGDSQLPRLADSVTAISQRAAKDETLRAAVSHLQNLAEEDQRLLVAVGLEGLSHLEAGQLLGIGEDTCRKRWQRLRERLQGDGVLRSLAIE